MKAIFQFFPFRQQKFIDLLQVMAFGLLASSFIYLIAANWWMIPKWLQLSIPQLILLLAAFGSVHFVNNERIRQSLDCICGLMVGLSLMVIGQVYQTGVDRYILFILWSVLLLPWLFRPNIGVFCLFSIVSEVALLLYCLQTVVFEHSDILYLVRFNLLSLILFIWAAKQYPALNYAFLLFYTGFSILCMFFFIGGDSFAFFISSLFLPIVLFIYFYSKKQPLGSSLSALSLGVCISIWFVNLIVQQNFVSISSFYFCLAFLIFIWFGLLSFILMRLLPKNHYYVIPLAFGAWLAGLLLAGTFLVNWASFSLLFAIVFIVLSLLILRSYQYAFFRQLAYCLWVCGQVAVIVHSYELTQSYVVVLAAQLILLCISFYQRSHWVFIALQLITSYMAALLLLFDCWDRNIFNTQQFVSIWQVLNLCCYSTIFLFGRRIQQQKHRSVMLFILVIILITSLQHQLGEIYHVQLLHFFSWNTLLPIVWVLISVWFVLKPQLNTMTTLTIACVGSLLSLLGYFEIYLILLIMAWALQFSERLIFSCALAILIFLCWQLYYLLELSFLFKAFSIFISGVLLLLLYVVLQKSLQHYPQQGLDQS